jgi:Protein of unknown function (DUF4241)
MCTTACGLHGSQWDRGSPTCTKDSEKRVPASLVGQPELMRPEQLTSWGPALALDVDRAELQRLDAGRLNIRSGRLAFANLGGGGCLDENMPCVDVPNGAHPVDVSLYRYWGGVGARDGADVTAVRVTFVDADINRWDPLTDRDERVRLFVDFGMASILDAEDAATAHHLATDEGVDILECLYEYRDTPWFMWHRGVLAFRCGRGDGAYDIWLGTSKDGRLAAIVIDLELLPEPDN